MRFNSLPPHTYSMTNTKIRTELEAVYEEIMWLAARPNVTPCVADHGTRMRPQSDSKNTLENSLDMSQVNQWILTMN